MAEKMLYCKFGRRIGLATVQQSQKRKQEICSDGAARGYFDPQEIHRERLDLQVLNLWECLEAEKLWAMVVDNKDSVLAVAAAAAAVAAPGKDRSKTPWLMVTMGKAELGMETVK